MEPLIDKEVDRESVETIPALEEEYSTTVQEYIEIIYHLVQKHKVARVKDIADKRGVTRSSVSTELNVLKDLDLIKHEHYGYVSMTEKGIKVAETLDFRHQILHDFFLYILDLDEDIADEEACKLEHSMSRVALNALLQYSHKVRQHKKSHRSQSTEFQ